METILLLLAIVSAFVLILDRKGYVSKLLSKAVDWLLAYKARMAVTAAGQAGFMNVDTAITAVITIVLVIIIVFNFLPTMEDSANVSGVTNTTVKTFGTLAGWLLPLLAIVGVVILGVRVFIKKGGKG
jgi:hypothetical protein